MRSDYAKMAYFQIMRLTFPRCKIIVTGKIVIHTEKNCRKKNKNMKISWKSAVLTALLSLIPWSSSAQVEKITDAVYRDHLKALPVLIKETENPYLKNHLAALKPENMQKKAFVTAVRVAADLKDRKDFSGQVIHYAVPAMSELMRLPEVYPLDGKALAPVRIVSAQDEYEPGSFQVYPLVNLGKVEFKLSVFKNENGVEFPADRLDLKVIKVWYQNRNAWWSYFADTELKLVPELLLNDEDLIKVDTERVQNYARITEKDGKTENRTAPLKSVWCAINTAYTCCSVHLTAKRKRSKRVLPEPAVLRCTLHPEKISRTIVLCRIQGIKHFKSGIPPTTHRNGGSWMFTARQILMSKRKRSLRKTAI